MSMMNALAALKAQQQLRDEHRKLSLPPAGGFRNHDDHVEFVRARCELVGIAMPGPMDIVG